MEIDPTVMDLISEDSDYQDIDGGGAVIKDSEDEIDQENVVLIPIPLLIVHVATPCPPVLRELIPINNPAPLVPLADVEDNTWYIPVGGHGGGEDQSVLM